MRLSHLQLNESYMCEANRTELTAGTSSCEMGGGAKASCNVNKTRKAYHLLLFHAMFWLSLFPFPKPLHSQSNVIFLSFITLISTSDNPVQVNIDGESLQNF